MLFIGFIGFFGFEFLVFLVFLVANPRNRGIGAHQSQGMACGPLLDYFLHRPKSKDAAAVILEGRVVKVKRERLELRMPRQEVALHASLAELCFQRIVGHISVARGQPERDRKPRPCMTDRVHTGPHLRSPGGLPFESSCLPNWTTGPKRVLDGGSPPSKLGC